MLGLFVPLEIILELNAKVSDVVCFFQIDSHHCVVSSTWISFTGNPHGLAF